MDIERIRSYLLGLPHVLETAQWGGLVFWVGDKAIGGKMFAMMRLDENESLERSEKSRVISYSAGPERYSELIEVDGIFPAPYSARIFWVAVSGWDVFRKTEWERELSAAHALTLAKLPPKVRAVLEMPAAQQKRLIAERRKLLAAKAARGR
ncbi:MmcQ/YjbR family DNA-binding protein [Tunturibacter empetritectus]|uniref:DNA-binding protein (MmcQ/YjbR family) n=1 Tax=Tunturiibacter empetritectus TaxID=3069691 RepID=A0A7W8IKD1_9BACT|nr:MmcQ/YjbR family DNA-binding protein [Edaphobacter lichenicola]MBB5318781.1 putative DNA-binding protein (MmcQ/YjbR family) [Edaphobacter lichenicola]